MCDGLEFGDVAGAMFGVEDFDAVEGFLENFHEGVADFADAGVGDEGEASGGVDGFNGFVAAHGFLGDVGFFSGFDVAIEGALDGGGFFECDDFLGDVHAADDAVAAFFFEGFYADGDVEFVKFVDDFFGAEGASVGEGLKSGGEGFAVGVNAESEDMDFHFAPARGDFDAGHEFESGLVGGGLGAGDAGEGVVVGDGDGAEPVFDCTCHDDFGIIGAVGEGGVEVEVYEF